VHTPHPTAVLPPRLKLLIIEFVGIATMAVGVDALYRGNLFVGLPLVPLGGDLLLRPAARRRLPSLERLVSRVLVGHRDRERAGLRTDDREARTRRRS
jgi:hypothetical protein